MLQLFFYLINVMKYRNRKPISAAKTVLILILATMANTCLSQKFSLKDPVFIGLSESRKTQGVAAADFNQDGFLDFFIVAADPYDDDIKGTWSRLYANNGDGTFQDVTVEAGLFNVRGRSERSDITVGVRSGASWGDFDNDGFVDLFIANDGYDFLYRNNGDGTFTEITKAAGVTGCESCYSATGLWWDYNLDGYLDLFVADFGQENRMFINNLDGTFTERASDLGLINSMHSWMALPIDIDADGDVDLYVSNDNEPNALYINEAGLFTNKASDYGLDDPGNGMGIGVSDYNLDGLFDIYVTNIHTNRANAFFVRETATGVFDNKAEELNIENTAWGWDMAFFDADHDLDEDLSVATYGSSDYNYYFENRLRREIRNFSNSSVSSGIHKIGASFGLESFDYDNDGDVDLLFSNSIREPFLFDNPIDEDGSNTNWVQFDLKGTVSNRDAFGTKVIITVNGVKYMRLNHGAGVGRHSKKPLHFGLSGNEIIDELEVIWPNGAIERYNNLPVNVKIGITENEGIVVNELNKAVKVDRNYSFDLSKSIARVWNDELLEAIRNDLARPTIHARNLFHISAAMYDVLSVFDQTLRPYLLGSMAGGSSCDMVPESYQFDRSDESTSAALSHAVYRLMAHRFQNSPGNSVIHDRIKSLMLELDYDVLNTSTDMSDGSSAALGNYIGQCYIDFGMTDGSNEINNYTNEYYTPVNPALVLSDQGNQTIIHPNRWQPLTLETFVDQSGNVLSNNTPEFLSPEWGNVVPFSLTDDDLTVHQRDGNTYKVYLDPSGPPLLDLSPNNEKGSTKADDNYKWGFSVVSAWSSHLSPSDDVLWDISPGSMGNVLEYPENFSDYDTFYDLENGGDPGLGRALNPITNLPYEPNIVPRGDYTRVLAEFWADGPHSETPPGHWFTLLNYVNDNLEEKKLEGDGRFLSDLNWDVFSYFALGGAMHDAAIAAWGIKGFYDYLRPISALRYMAGKGQSSDPSLPSFNAHGVPLIDGFVELVLSDDPLALNDQSKVDAIKIKAWKGPSYINDESSDTAGVDWILAEDWWPYQRPSFVTPPFAGYISGHSTYSRAAAEVLTRLTGTEYFPGGMGEFVAEKDEFLVFEDGPSVDVVLQWATYRDASDQCSLSRIWGGIHPPADDIPGRKIGDQIGNQAYDYAKTFFADFITSSEENISPKQEATIVYPNPTDLGYFDIRTDGGLLRNITLIDVSSNQQIIRVSEIEPLAVYRVNHNLKAGVYILLLETKVGITSKRVILK
ncbi:MAG: hypothetical protein ACJAS3_000916 [Roseivirga sp.]|jgi:hypothetical protein